MKHKEYCLKKKKKMESHYQDKEFNMVRHITENKQSVSY